MLFDHHKKSKEKVMKEYMSLVKEWIEECRLWEYSLALDLYILSSPNIHWSIEDKKTHLMSLNPTLTENVLPTRRMITNAQSSSKSFCSSIFFDVFFMLHISLSLLLLPILATLSTSFFLTHFCSLGLSSRATLSWGWKPASIISSLCSYENRRPIPGPNKASSCPL
jgi:hypothetical protein